MEDERITEEDTKTHAIDGPHLTGDEMETFDNVKLVHSSISNEMRHTCCHHRQNGSTIPRHKRYSMY